MKKRVFVDMDGVLCEYKPVACLSDWDQDGYFRHLSPRQIMVNAVRLLIQSGIADVYILSSVLSQREAEATWEKNQWLYQYLPEIDYNHRLFPLCGTNKADKAGPIDGNDILCDDHTPNLRQWVQSGGKGIKILNEINGAGGTFQCGLRMKLTKPEELLFAISSL